MADQINKNVQRISLYVDASSNNPARVYAKQWDTKSRYIIATIKDHFGRVKIGGVAQLNAKKPDGTFCYTGCTINDYSAVTIEIPTQILAAAGEVKCDISFFATEDSDQVLLTTSTFIIVVQKSNYDTDAIESSNEYSVVTENLKKADENCKLAIEAAEQTEQNRVLTESAKNDAETAAKTAVSVEQSVSEMMQRTEAAAGQVGSILNDVNAAKEASGNAVATATAASDKADEAIKAVGDVEKKSEEARNQIYGISGEIVLAVSGWSNGRYTAKIEGLGDDDALIIGGSTLDDQKLIGKASLFATASGEAVTFEADPAPEGDITVSYFIARGK